MPQNRRVHPGVDTGAVPPNGPNGEPYMQQRIFPVLFLVPGGPIWKNSWADEETPVDASTKLSELGLPERGIDLFFTSKWIDIDVIP